MNPRRRRCLSLQNLRWLLLVVATVSMVATFHLGDSLTWFRSRSDEATNELHGTAIVNKDKLHLTRRRHNATTSHMTRGQVLIGQPQLQFESVFIQHENPGNVSRKVDRTAGIKSPGFSRANNAYVSMAELQSRHKDSFDRRDLSRQTSDDNESNASFITETLQAYVNVKGIQKVTSGLKTPFTNNHGTSHREPGISPRSRPTFRVGQAEHINIKALLLDAVNPVQVSGDLKSNNSPGDMKAEASPGSANLTTLVILYEKISKIEASSLLAPSVVVKGPLPLIKHHLPLIESAFRKFKAKVTYQDSGDQTKPEAGGDNRCIVMCLNTTYKGDSCVISAKPLIFARATTIPQLMPLTLSPRLLCDVTEEKLPEKARGLWYRGRLPCYTNGSQFNAKEDKCDVTSGWWVVNSDNSRQYFACGKGSLPFGNRSRSTDSIIIPLPNNLLTLDGTGSLVWQVEVLVTSLLPLRVYLHPAGLAWSGIHEFIHRKHQKNVSLYELRQLVTEWGNISATLAQLEIVIMEAIRLATNHLTLSTDNHRFCQKCFQLLAVVLVFDSSFQPIVLEVAPSHCSEHLNSLSDYLLEQNILEDFAAMLTSKALLSAEILKALVYLGAMHIRNEKVCTEKNDICLGEHEINYLLDTRREQRSARNWIRLFPSTVFSCTQIHSSPSRILVAEYEFSQKPNGPFEKFASLVEEYFLCPVQNMEKIVRLKAGLNVTVNTKLNGTDNLLTGNLSNMSNFLTQNCDNDKSSLLYLRAIRTYPYIQLFPEFSPLQTEYQAYVDYYTTLVQVCGVPKHCGTHAKLEDKHGSSRWCNFSLGLGENTAHIMVVGMDHLEPYILNIYKVIIHRRGPGHDRKRFNPHTEHPHVCSLKQDCSLPLSPNITCGLQPVLYMTSWKEFLKYQSTLPSCEPGSMTGEWMVPCSNCHSESSCYWSDAIWQPPGCREGKLQTDQIKNCFAGKKVLFIGDSTNRGILHYILERLNGSLVQWDKTHNIRIYPDLNGGQTVFGFAYYPQFWLMYSERPMLDKAFYQLLNRTLEWPDKDLIIVLGGVHWLAKHHLDMLVEVLSREGLNRSRVIVKGLGAGFHQPVSGVHQLSLEEQTRLSSQNQAVLSHAQQLGFSTVDTFSMTMARYRNFLQGKCACHFHQVTAMQPSAATKLSLNSSVAADQIIRYHVQGEINAVYSEMVINRICAYNGM